VVGFRPSVSLNVILLDKVGERSVFPSLDSQGQQHRPGTRSAPGKEVLQELMKGCGMRGRSSECFSGKGSSMCKGLKEMMNFCRNPEENFSLAQRVRKQSEIFH